jgi:hypothetical protein
MTNDQGAKKNRRSLNRRSGENWRREPESNRKTMIFNLPVALRVAQAVIRQPHNWHH